MKIAAEHRSLSIIFLAHKEFRDKDDGEYFVRLPSCCTYEGNEKTRNKSILTLIIKLIKIIKLILAQNFK